jgi:hypothetical protein
MKEHTLTSKITSFPFVKDARLPAWVSLISLISIFLLKMIYVKWTAVNIKENCDGIAKKKISGGIALARPWLI